jgi:uncharacterized repeat protein (TIGR01451 family)
MRCLGGSRVTISGRVKEVQVNKKVLFIALALVMALALPILVLAQPGWSDNFDSYPTGQNMHGIGGWKGWDNDPSATAYTTDTLALSTPNSVVVTGFADLVHEYSGYTEGQWHYTGWQYIPANLAGTTYFIMLNTYNDGGPYNWSTEIQFNSTSGTVIDDGQSGATTPIIFDQWVELRVEIDLDADTQNFYYDGVLFYSGTWSTHVGSPGVVNIGAVDLWNNGATDVYYDDFSLVPAVAVELLKGPDTQTIVSGGTAAFTMTVGNPGATDLTGVTVTDALAPDCDNVVGDLPAGAYVEVVPPTSVSLSSFDASESGATWVLALAAGIIGVGVVVLISRRRRVA